MILATHAAAVASLIQADGGAPLQLKDFVLDTYVYAAGLLIVGLAAGLVHFRVLRPMLLDPAQLPGGRPAWQQVLFALLATWSVQLAAVGGGWLAHGYDPARPGFAAFVPLFTGQETVPGWLAWLFFTIQSSFEELLFRGIGMALLACLVAWLIGLISTTGTTVPEQAGGITSDPRERQQLWFYSGLAANIVVSAGFASVHRDNPEVNAIALLNIALAGLALGQIYWLQGSLWGACAMHAAWNATLTTFGLPVSGFTLRTALIGNISGAAPGLLTGGAFGPEASLPATFGLLALWLWLVWLCWRKTQGARPRSS